MPNAHSLPQAEAEEPTRPENVISIMDALKKSIAAAGAAKAAKAEAAESAAPVSKPKAASKTKGAPAKPVDTTVAAKVKKAR